MKRKHTVALLLVMIIISFSILPGIATLEEELDDDTFLEIVKENDTYECFIVRKKFLSYCHDVTGHNYFWHNNEVNSKTLPYVLNIPKLKENETETLIFYSVLDSDINMAYVDGNEMQIITDGNIRLAYYI